MKRNLKALGLALVAAFAMSAVAASAASAHYVITPGANPSIITGVQIAHSAGNVFTITSGGETTCTGATYVGTTEGNALEDVTVHPTYTGCTSAGIATTVDTAGCDFTLTGETDAAGHGKTHVICEAGKAIEITIPSISCTIKIHEQTPTGGGITYTNVAGSSPAHIEATATVTGITYERVQNGFFCELAVPTKEGNDADLLTKLTVKDYVDNGFNGTGTLTQGGLTPKEGNQVSLVVDSA